MLGALADAGVPRIHFGVGTGELLAPMREAGADVVGVDWRTAAGRGRPPGRRPGRRVLQGNLDPAVLFAAGPSSRPRCAGSSTRVARPPGHIFNLGHGVLPETDPDVLTWVVELVHSL